MEWVALLLFVSVILVLLAGFPVAFTLAGTALIFAGIGSLTGDFSVALLSGLPNRVFGIMTNESLVAVPLFVFMGVTLERAKIAGELLDTLGSLFGAIRGGLGISVTLVGMLLAAPITAVVRIVLGRLEITRPVAELLAGRLPANLPTGTYPAVAKRAAAGGS